ncbi:MAG: hypothetical protein ACI8V4_003866 [Ilumatobacter sp.]
MPEGAVDLVIEVGCDPPGLDQPIVERGKASPQHADVDEVGQMPSNVVRDRAVSGNPDLADYLCGLTAIM